MNISSMVRGLTGDAKPGEARVLELKTGQQVRGVVQSVSADGKDAVVQINGVAVKAVLESPLQPGQATWLQVAGQQEDGTIVLKPSDGPNAQPMASIADALKQADLPDEPWARQLIQELQKNGVPITREMMEQLGQALKMKPSGVSLEQWAQTVAVAMKRQLPLTAAGLTGLQQAMFGKPLNELLSNFLKNTELLQGNIANNGNAASNAVLKEAQALVRTVLAIMPNANASVEAQIAQPAGNNTGTASAGTAAGAQASGQTPQGQNAPATAAGASNAAASSANLSQTGTNVSLAKEGAAPQSTTAGTEAGRPAAQQAASTQAPAGAQAAAQAQTEAAAGVAAGARAAANASGASGEAQQVGQAAQGGSQSTHAGGMIGRMLTLLGVSHEHVVQRALLAPSGSAAASQAPAGAAPEQAAPQQAAAAPVAASTAAAAQQAATQATAPQQAAAAQALPAGAAEAHESLKSTLLQLLKSDSLPPAIRESAQQIVQQITGQQLLLSSDRSQPFAHVTMFVPFVTDDGEQTAAVHIQSRQGRKGELDADNCRLWFDLELKTLGRTMVDVNVVEKLVALNIHHEDEQVQEQLRPFRIEIESALESIGYQMSAYRVMPFPEKEETAQPAEKLMKDYTVENYRGVDLRI